MSPNMALHNILLLPFELLEWICFCKVIFCVQESSVSEQRSTIEMLSQQLDMEKANLMNAVSTVNQTRQQSERVEMHMTTRDAQVKELQQKLDVADHKLRKADANFHLSQEELRTLHGDMANMVKENQFLNHELAQLQQDRDTRAEEGERMRVQLNFSEELTQAKEREKNDVLRTYRLACDENKRLKLSLTDFESEMNRARAHIHQLERQLTKVSLIS
jgi:chromosome segregation ATPase